MSDSVEEISENHTNVQNPKDVNDFSAVDANSRPIWLGTVKEYSDSDITDNSEDASKLRAAIFRASKKRQTPYARNPPAQSSFQRSRPGIFDGMSDNQHFLGSQNYGQCQNFTPRAPFPSYRQDFAPGANVTCHYCYLPGHFAKFCPYTAQLHRRQQAPAMVISPEPFNKQQLGKYIASACIIEKSGEFLFTAINLMKTSGEYKATNKSKPLSYTRCRENLLSALKDIGLDSSLYAFYSLRSGGVLAAANNKFPDRLLKMKFRSRLFILLVFHCEQILVLCMSDVIQGLSLLNFKIIGNDETFYYRCSTNRKCKCSNITDGILADCSALNLTKSPYFEERVVSVNLSRNLLTHLPDEGLLPAKLKYLDLAENNISKFTKGELAPFSTARNIISLNLSTNLLSLDIDTYYKGVFQNLKYLQYLDLSNNSNANKSYYCPDKVFQELSSLQSLLIDGVKNVTFGKGFSTLKNLTLLQITGIATNWYLSRGYFDNFPNLEHLDISATTEWRKISDFALISVEKGVFQKLTKLQYLDISYHRKLHMCGFQNVTNDLQYTSIRILKANYLECERSVSTVLFVDDIKSLNTTKIEELYLDGNNLEETDYLVPRFLPPSLHYFSARNNRWVVNKYAYFYIAGLTGIRTVDLSFQNKHQFSQSKSAWLCSEVFHETTHWICNRVPHYLDESSFLNMDLHDDILHASNKKDDDPLITSCIPYDALLFQLALIPANTETIIIESAKVGENIPPIYFSTSSVKKISLQGNQLYSFTGPICNLTELQYLDLSSNRAVDISSYVFGSLIGLTHLKIDNNLLGEYGIDHDKTDGNFQFDAFISYAENDRWFPKDYMINFLEKQKELRLCIHHRDFIAGSAIAENITNAIHNSRKFVCILTNDFLESKWCMYEFYIALEDIVVSRQGRNSIIIVQLLRTDIRNIPREMRYIMNNDTYLDYPEDEEDRVVFWESFERDLKF
ncbi:unnamed protein product [Mytilus coruscus]|uniref:TIR domain-containing protein n=1 Tax=Mytilus coruscus TaxID=42192 RepID=A0A6J8DCR9_MYTCO|nr:unnamed protein product [Mytilus coruscus]